VREKGEGMVQKKERVKTGAFTTLLKEKKSREIKKNLTEKR